jgi:hypothetical protein
MIRPLRRRHRGLIATLFLLLAVAALLALTHPAPSARMDTMPSALGARPTNDDPTTEDKLNLRVPRVLSGNSPARGSRTSP